MTNSSTWEDSRELPRKVSLGSDVLSALAHPDLTLCPGSGIPGLDGFQCLYLRWVSWPSCPVLLSLLGALRARIFTLLKLRAILRSWDLSWNWFWGKPWQPTYEFPVAPVWSWHLTPLLPLQLGHYKQNKTSSKKWDGVPGLGSSPKSRYFKWIRKWPLWPTLS